MEAVTTKLSGLWTYRSFRNPTSVSRTGPQKAQPAAHEFILQEADFNLKTATDPAALEGTIEWEGGGLNLQGRVGGASFSIRGTGRPGTATADWEYLYHGHLIPGWPKPPDVNAVDQRPALVGCVLRTKPHGAAPAWYVAPFIAVKRQPPFTSELSGSWIYRSFNPTFVEGDQTAPQERQLIVADGVFKLETPTSTTLKGALEGPGWFLDLLNGRVQPDALGYETSSFEIVGTGRPDTYTAGWEYHYHGHLTRWPDHIDDRPPLVGSVFRAKTHNGVPPRSPAGEVFSFIAVKQP